MSYKDREQYLGFSDKLGYLDKGGKWRRKDWWHQKKDKNEGKDEVSEMLRLEKLQAKREDQALLNFKLREDGLAGTDANDAGLIEGCTDIS